MWGGYNIVVHQELGDAVAGVVSIGLVVVCLIAVAVVAPKSYIRVDDSTITFGPKLVRLISYDRREVARIRMSHSPLMRSALFLRSDGSILRSTPGSFWGREGMQRLANYLGVPLEG